MSRNWASTLRLPSSNFPFRTRSDLKAVYLRWCTDDLYAWQSDHRAHDNTFVLHDGPPYANGSLHVGHALNKILKDMILRFNIQKGHRVEYVPGWDCHGLPIEMKALRDGTAQETQKLPATVIRSKARKLASSAIVEQMESFRSYAVMGDWARKWTTMDPAFEIRQLELFQAMLEKGLIYRKYKPVYWSTTLQTALAEAEIEYDPKHVSKCAWVAIPVVDESNQLVQDGQALHAVIWTTTPWTLPANKAIAFNENIAYRIIRFDDNLFIVASERYKSFLHYFKNAYGVPQEVRGISHIQISQLKYRNPLHGPDAELQPFVHAEFVTNDSGSGLVHVAPGHGFEDHDLCLKLGIPLSSPVADSGKLTKDASPYHPGKLEGYDVMEDASDAVLKLLGKLVLGRHNLKHKYPCDWRTKKPVIVRATQQWFADVETIKSKALMASSKADFIPVSGGNRLHSFISARNEWCISRQRSWGVPIPALYRPDGSVIATPESVAHIISVMKKKGTDAWWSDSPDHNDWVLPSLRGQDLRRGTDTMDVWFDSGSSWRMLNGPAHVYLEGSDQHRGWFQSSLLTYVAFQSSDVAEAKPPFHAVITHGFTLDEKGKKMSKSLGNTISPDQIMNGTLLPPIPSRNKSVQNEPPKYDALGPDALRLWVASSEYTKDVALGRQVLRTVHKSLNKYRSIIKMLLGAMNPEMRVGKWNLVDQIALHQLDRVLAEVKDHYARYNFYRAIAAINNWISNDLSAFYLEISKDRLYCGDGGGVLEPIFHGLMRMLAPITPMLVTEAWDHCPSWMKDHGVKHPLVQLWNDPLYEESRLPFPRDLVHQDMPKLMDLKQRVIKALEDSRTKGQLGSSLESTVIIRRSRRYDVVVGETDPNWLVNKYGIDFLEMLLVVSKVLDVSEANPLPDPAASIEITIEPPQGHKCMRCWRYKAREVEGVCDRCEILVNAMGRESGGKEKVKASQPQEDEMVVVSDGNVKVDVFVEARTHLISALEVSIKALEKTTTKLTPYVMDIAHKHLLAEMTALGKGLEETTAKLRAHPRI